MVEPITLVKRWHETAASSTQNTESIAKESKSKWAYRQCLNERVAVWQGDITKLQVDAIVNAANNSLLGGGGVDGAIHKAAGPQLRQECAALNGCRTGEAKVTAGYRLPAKHVIHTVGPVGEKAELLKKCYRHSLDLMLDFGLKSVAFPCISTGVYGYPALEAAHVALGTVREWLDEQFSRNEDYENVVDLIVFCVFLEQDLDIYHQLLPVYFPRQ